MRLTFLNSSRRSFRSLGAAFAATLALCSLTSAVQAQVEFQGLGDLPGGTFYSTATAVSADGAVVVGTSDSGVGGEAFRWTKAGGMVGLGDLPGGSFNSYAKGVSADGMVVVGDSDDQVFRLDLSVPGGMVGLGSPPGGSHISAAGVSGNGNVIVGDFSISDFYNSTTEAFQWHKPGGLFEGMHGMGIPDYFKATRALAVNADGTVIVGWLYVSQYGNQGFRWTPGGGYAMLGALPNPTGTPASYAHAVSADGAVVVGKSILAQGQYGQAFRWTEAGGMKSLGDIPGGSIDACALGVNSDGSVIVGRGSSDQGYEAFVWNSIHGTVSLKKYLRANYAASLPANFSKWTLSEATAVSADGTTIVGWGINPAGKKAAWRVRKADGFDTVLYSPGPWLP